MSLRCDNFLIDKAFQPAADRLATCASCYQIAADLFLGAAICGAVDAVVREHTWILRFVALGFALFCLLWRREARKEGARTRIGFCPQFRITGYITRWMYLMWTAFLLVSDLLTLSVSPIDLAFLLLTAGTYFMACTRRPPMRQEAKIPKHAVTAPG